MDFPTIIGSLIAGAGAGLGTAAALSKAIAERAISHTFDTKLEAFRTSQAQIIAEAKVELDATLDRRTRLHGREFEVVPEIWDLANVAAAHMIAITAKGATYPGIRSLEPEHLRRALVDFGLNEIEVADVMNAPGESQRLNTFHRAIDRVRRSDAINHLGAFRRALTSKGIFLRDPLHGQFERLDVLVWDAWVEMSFSVQWGVSDTDWSKRELMHREVEGLLKGMANGIRTGMWGSDLTAPVVLPVETA